MCNPSYTIEEIEWSKISCHLTYGNLKMQTLLLTPYIYLYSHIFEKLLNFELYGVNDILKMTTSQIRPIPMTTFFSLKKCPVFFKLS